MASAFQPTHRARLRRALGLAVALATLGLGAAPAVSSPLDGGLFTLPDAPEQPTPAPTPPVAELRPAEPPQLDPPLLPEPALQPAPAPGPEPAPGLAPSPAPELTPLLTALLAPAPGGQDDVGESSLSHVTFGPSSTSAGEDSKTLAADTPQGTASPAASTPFGTVTAATLMPVIDAVSRPIGPARRSREIAPTGPGGRSPAPVRVASAPLGPIRTGASNTSRAPAGADPRSAPAVPAPPAPRVHHQPAPAAVPHTAGRVAGAVADAGRSPWLPIALLLATVAYVLGQRLMDGGSKLSHAGHGDEPDDELIEL